MRFRSYSYLLAVVFALGVLPSVSQAVTIFLGAAKDNSMYANSVNNSNGAGTELYSGLSGAGIRRALIAFDIASNVPSGATISDVQLTLNVLGQGAGSGSEQYSLHNLTTDWGEGTSFGGGQGAPATPGDATWQNNFFGSSSWGTAGGDFNAAASATQTVSGLGNVAWGSTAGLVGDVQNWLDNSGSNFGWILRGNESADRTARKFNSRENSTNAPSLRIIYTMVPEPHSIAIGLIAAMSSMTLVRRTGTWRCFP